MRTITFWFDPISPYAYLAFEHLPQALEGLSYRVEYRPVLFAALLRHHGQLGPAEIPAKRDWTYRQVLWLARRHGIPMQMPAQHPFNPLALLRLMLACEDGPLVSRHVAECALHHVWRGGGDALEPGRLAALRDQLPPLRHTPDSDGVKARLRANGEAAIAAGLFGVPTLACDGRLFWGFDALPMLRAAIEGDDWFDGAEWRDAAARPGLQRAS